MGAAILNTSVFGTFNTFCSLLQDLLARFKSKNISIVFLFKSPWGKNSHSGKSFNNLISNSILVYSGIQRTSETIEKDKVNNISKNINNFKTILEISDEAKIILESNSNFNITSIAKLLNESWKCKRELSKYVSNSKLDSLYQFGLKNGAIGGKLLGAGGGGYILFLSKNKANQEKLIRSLKKNVYFKFEIDHKGTQILQSLW